jgi:hypothetical protein
VLRAGGFFLSFFFLWVETQPPLIGVVGGEQLVIVDNLTLTNDHIIIIQGV